MTKGSHAQSFVYVMHDGYATKVGVTGNAKNRRDALQSGNPRTVKLAFVAGPFVNLMAFAIEKEVQLLVGGVRLEAEWFAADPDEVIKHLQQRVAIKLFSK